MLTLMLAWVSLIPSILLSPTKYLWAVTTTQSFTLAFLSIPWIFLQNFNLFNSTFLVDKTSAPLMILTCWLFPLTILASQSKLINEPINRQRTYIVNCSILQLSTLLAFAAADLLTFFIFFEASLIPTLFMITRWGAQERRLTAGYSFSLYTLIGAIPLLIWTLKLYEKYGTLYLPTMNLLPQTLTPGSYELLFWATCNLAFLIKLPLFTFHLWLPQAHVEAPIAGSMILAGTLLKLGGYGILRTSFLIQEPATNKALYILALATLGILATALLCLRQTDLKSLIAMSSVSHMNLIIVAVLTCSQWAFSGAMIMMIAHGLTSSTMFCLANTLYERTNTRTMIVLRGTLTMSPLAASWWLFTILLNMALPPTINFNSELLMMLAIYDWSILSFLLVALNLIATTAYTLYLLWSTQRGPFPKHINTTHPLYTREHVLLTLHILPTLLLILKPELIMM
ncbi:NADH dehydrogenase subunit 4 (mitochondrion) [Pyxicephalus adspersus]|uniref:NADH-ubiquinone oxidoreductase chain 4 n=1 Tax=Pyxicephalus adspersus TaxID=30357 RepID=A0A5B8GX96_PYXAD|nr:NADH dehydrogenase subunit 4 [Pyxicephalus adspersus]QDW76107.1 NADH dehydrogenase subunit 4 [Pyxicephalus adspersus]